MNIAIIPARAGSKRLPGKNIALFNGKPLIDWTIRAALESGEFDSVIVSTDSEEILARAAVYGLPSKHLRPEKLASDNASTIDVMLYEVERLRSECSYSVDTVTCLQPTSPLRNYKDIKRAFEIYRSQNRLSVVSVSKPWNPAEFIMRLDDIDTIDFSQIRELKRTQDLKQGFALNGAIYVSNYECLVQQKSFYNDNTGAYIMPRERAFDIDDEIDFKMAELVEKHLMYDL